MFLHNAMFDFGASHNLIPKIVMDNLGLDITRPYKDLYSFDSREVKCLKMIKDLKIKEKKKEKEKKKKKKKFLYSLYFVLVFQLIIFQSF
jgi:hypothetical protein